MADFRVEGDDIKRMVKAAKKAPVGLAFNPGGGDEDGYLAMHRTKSPESLGKDAKAGADGGKVAFGTAVVEAKVLTLTCLREMPGAAKKLKKYLKSQKVMLNVVILDADGNVLESDIEDDLPDDPSLAEGDDGATDAEGDAGGLAQRIADLRARLAGAPPDATAPLLGALDRIEGFLGTGEAERAAAGIDKVEPLVAQLLAKGAPPAAPPPPPDPRLARLAQAAAQIRGQIEALADEKTKATLTAALGRVAGHLRIGEADAALELLKKMQDAMRGPGTAAGGRQLLPLWTAAREATGEQIGKLQAQLKESGLPLFERIADKGLHGVTEGQLVAMQAALMGYDAAAGPAREAALVKLRAAVAAMRAFLGSNPVLPLLEQNPFGVEVSLRAELGGALDAIETAMAA